MRFLTYNIGYGMSRNGGGNLDRIAEAVDGADVIALQEVERFWPRSGMVDQPRQLGRRLPVLVGVRLEHRSPLLGDLSR